MPRGPALTGSASLLRGPFASSGPLHQDASLESRRSPGDEQEAR